MSTDKQKRAEAHDDARKMRALRRLNAGAAVLHALSFAAALSVAIVYRSQSLQSELTVDFRNRYEDAPVPLRPDAAGPYVPQLKTLGFYQLVWVELPFPLITALFHAAIAFVPAVWRYYANTLRSEGRNPIRWIEYSITASFMTWSILQLSGVTNLFLLASVGVVMNVALQYQGHAMELLNSPHMQTQRKKRRKVVWTPTAVGWLLFAMQWAVVFAYFFAAVSAERPPDADAVPWFVYVVVPVLFVMYSLFGVVQLLHYARWLRWLRSAYNTEVAFIALSFASKFVLDWLVIIGIVTGR